MKVEFDKSFYKRLLKINDKVVLEKVKQVILTTETVTDIAQIPILKKWKDSFPTIDQNRGLQCWH